MHDSNLLMYNIFVFIEVICHFLFIAKLKSSKSDEKEAAASKTKKYSFSNHTYPLLSYDSFPGMDHIEAVICLHQPLGKDLKVSHHNQPHPPPQVYINNILLIKF